MTAAALDRVDRAEFFSRFNEGEAVPYFYEPFLEAFDPALRKQLGVWYTPTEVVRYPAFEVPHDIVPGIMTNVDSSLHRSISDLTAFIGRPKHHRVIVAGDFTVMRGPRQYHDAYWSAPAQTVFDRMDALGLQCVGPEAPHGRQADPWPEWLPRESKNVPTFRRIGTSPADAEAQLDYVFASKGMVDAVRVYALNGPDEWGPSDHCRVVIEVR